MAEYWTSLHQIYLCMVFLLLLCLGENCINASKCHHNKYGVRSADGKISCRPCTNLHGCPHGMGVSIACGDIVPDGTHIQCVPCVLGRNFSANYDNKPCQSCRSMFCHKNEKIIGTCLVEKDSSKCSGTCKTGLYPNGNRLADCQPCSVCRNGSLARRVEKCKNDGLPISKQCEVGTQPLFTFENQLHPSDKKDDAGHEGEKVYKFYGHPAWSVSWLVVVVVLLLLLAWSCRHKCQRQMQTVVYNEAEVPLRDVLVVDRGVNETDSYDGTTDLTGIQSVRKRKSSTSSGGRKVSFSRQNSNSGSDFSDERSLQSGAPVTEISGETDDVEKNTLQVPTRRRTLPGSPGKRGRIFNRQNSNPVPEHTEQRPFHKRSKTFSSFSSIISGQKGTAEETTPMLQSADFNENEIPLIVALPDQTSSCTAHQRLTGVKVGKMNAETYRKLCALLNREVQNDWKILAGRMGYYNDYVKGLEKAKDPADKLLEDWSTQEGNDAAKLLELTRGMNRADVVKLLENESTKVEFQIGDK